MRRKKILDPVISIRGEQPADAARILRDLTKIVSYNRCYGRCGSYLYRLAIDDVTVEYIPRKKNASRTYRHFLLDIDIRNRIWEERTTPLGYKYFASVILPIKRVQSA